MVSEGVIGVLAVLAILIAGSRLVKHDDERRAEKRSYEKGQSFPVRKRR